MRHVRRTGGGCGVWAAWGGRKSKSGWGHLLPADLRAFGIKADVDECSPG